MLELVDDKSEEQQLGMDEDDILTVVGQELNDAAGGNENDSLDANRRAALAAYLGDSKPVPEGRSSVVSTDVADAIEWILPEIVKAFTQNNEIVTFDPIGDGDEEQAELESKFVYDTLMKDNEGFIILHQMIKDALMQKNGFVKIWYSDIEKTSTASYTGLTQPELQMLLARPGYEMIEQTVNEEEQIPTFDVKFQITEKDRKLNVCSVPPEEFRVNRMHNSVALDGARFTAHAMYKTRSDLVELGVPREIVDDLPTDPTANSERYYRFTEQGEVTEPEGGISNDPSQDIVEVAECYMRMDVDGDGIAEMVKVTVAGWSSPSHLLDIEPIEEIPFISSTAILMSHKLFGLSIYDRLIQIQEQKTSLWRNIFDNIYLQNNQRTGVIEGQVNLDDLMLSRPGGIVRMTRPDAVTPLPNPQLSPESYKMMDYLDQVRAGRAGVSPEGGVNDQMIGDRVGSEGVRDLLNQKEELVGLMIRVIAETGVKKICYMIRSLLRKHQDTAKDYKFRGLWVQVEPQKWGDRPSATVRVGTGSGNRKEQQQTLLFLSERQREMKQMPGQTMVTPKGEYALLNDFAKMGGFGSVGQYFLDPESPEGQKMAQQVGQQMQQKEMEAKQKDQAIIKAQLDLAKSELREAETRSQLAVLKGETEQVKNQLEAQKQRSASIVSRLEQQLDEAKLAVDASIDAAELRFKKWDREQYYEVERYRINETAKAARENNAGNNDGE
jgi:hypothetical protein